MPKKCVKDDVIMLIELIKTTLNFINGALYSLDLSLDIILMFSFGSEGVCVVCAT